MKCPNCGHELEAGSGFCENCGMITSLESEDASAFSNEKDEVFREVYSSSPEKTDSEMPEENDAVGSPAHEDDDAPRELEADETEQIVPVVEYPEKEPEKSRDRSETKKESSDFESDDEYIGDGEPEDDEGYDGDEGVYTQEAGDEPEHEYDEDGEEEDDNTAQDNDDGLESEDEDDELDDMYVTSSKSKRNSIIIAVLIVAIVAVTAGAVTMIKDNFSKVPVDAPASSAEVASSEKEKATTQTTSESDSEASAETTQEETGEEETTDRETEKETTEKTSEAVTEPSNQTTTEKQTTTRVATTKPATTTKPTTTKPTTTKPVTTTKPTTAKPTTTKSTTAKPTTTGAATTTDPYGFGTEKAQKPDTYLASSDRYTVYVTADSLTMRSKPDITASRVVYVSLGESLTVYGKSQNGFTYVRSDRFGVYGWVSNSYISKTRPQSEQTVVVPGVVEPDKQYAEPKTMYVNADIGIRLRKAPSTDAASVRSLSYGFPVKVTGYSSKNSGWVYVTDVTHGVTGWTRAEWLTDKT